MSNIHLECLTAAPAQEGEGTATARVYMITRCADQVSMTTVADSIVVGGELEF